MSDNRERTALTPQEFAHLGGGAIAYVKAIKSEDAQRLFPQAPAICPPVVPTPRCCPRHPGNPREPRDSR